MSEMPEWLSDVLYFLRSVAWRWINVVGCAAIAFAEIVFPKITHGREFPVGTWWILGGCFFCASFLAWRDEHQKVRGEERLSILTKIVDLISDPTKLALDRRFDPIAALIKFSADFKTETDVEWVCAELEKRDHGNAFAFFQLQYGLPAANGRRLKFIRDARLSGRQIRLDIHASDYLNTTWAEENHLSRMPYSSTSEGSEMASKYRTWKDKMMKRRFDMQRN